MNRNPSHTNEPTSKANRRAAASRPLIVPAARLRFSKIARNRFAPTTIAAQSRIPPEVSPPTLKISVRITLTSRHLMFVWRGEQVINLSNDSQVAFLCARHPAALAQPAATVWPEIWDQVGSRTAFATRRDEGTYDETLPFIMLRKGYPEETYAIFSYRPKGTRRG
jgi:hypothetical protein